MLTKENGFTLPIKWKLPDADKYVFTFITLLIILLTSYSNSFYGEWHFDDFINIVENHHIQVKSFTWKEIKPSFYGLEQKNLSRPLSYLSFAVNYYFHEKEEFGYHLVNFIIHYLASLFLFLFIYNTLKLPLIKEKYAGIAYPTALLATLFWAVNPVQVSSISYIVQRMASLAGMFYIMSMYLYLKARTADKTIYSVLLFICCALSGLSAIFSKENAVMLPMSIILFDLFLVQGVNEHNFKKFIKLIFLPLVIIVAFGFVYTGGLSRAFGGYELRDFTMGERLLTQPRIILFYLSLLLYPINSRLTLLYDVEVSNSLFQPWTTLPAVLLILAAIGLAFYLAKKRPLLSFCIIFYFLNHFIEGSFFSLELIYEHRNYLPAMLLFVPVAEFILYAVNYFSYRKIIQIIVSFSIVIILVGLGDNTYQRNMIFSSDMRLWLDNISKSPQLSRPYANLGRIYFNSGMNEKALIEYQKALSLNKYGNKMIAAIQDYNLGLLYFNEMKDDLALRYFQKSLIMLPEYIQNSLHIAKIKIRQNNLAEARQIIEAKLNKYPDNKDLMELYSFILLKGGEIDRSQDYAKKILLRHPDSVFSLKIMAEACRKKGNLPSAAAYFKSLRRLAPQNPHVNLALIEIYAKTDRQKMLAQEIRLFLYWKGSFTAAEYIERLTKDKPLLIYVPDPDLISSILNKNCKKLI